jgi:hypothetical protein
VSKSERRVPVLAHKGGITIVLGLLFGQGAMCAKCGYGTRATSKNWARCKKCGHRNRRRTIEEASALMDQAIAETEAKLAAAEGAHHDEPTP